MSDRHDDFTNKRFQLKQQFYRRAAAEGRGPEALAHLNRIAKNVKTTRETPDEEILKDFAQMEREEREEVRRIIEECVNKTDFNREDPPEVKELMIQDLTEQELTIDLLRSEGMPEDKLPQLSIGLARLNAYEKLKGEGGDAWSDNDKQVQVARNKARMILSMQSPNLLFH